MDWAKLKEGLKTAMSISTDLNKFVTDNEIWSSSADPERRRVVVSILLNGIRLLAAL
jgi:methionyl-tRNA synthetase